MQDDTKLALIYTAGYMFRKDEGIKRVLYYEKCSSFIKIMRRERLKMPDDRYSLSVEKFVTVSEYQSLNMDRNYGNLTANIILKSYSYLVIFILLSERINANVIETCSLIM